MEIYDHQRSKGLLHIKEEIESVPGSLIGQSDQGDKWHLFASLTLTLLFIHGDMWDICASWPFFFFFIKVITYCLKVKYNNALDNDIDLYWLIIMQWTHMRIRANT